MNKVLLCLLSIPMALGMLSPQEVNLKNDEAKDAATCQIDQDFEAWLDTVGFTYEDTELTIGKGDGNDDLLDDITSLKGLECFSNLIELNVKDLPNLVEINLSTSVMIDNIYLQELENLESLTVTNQDELISLNLSDLPALEKLNISQNKKFKMIDIQTMLNLEILNLSNNPKLEEVYVQNAKNIQEISVEGDVSLMDFHLYNVEKLSKLDFQTNNHLDNIVLYDVMGLEEIIQPSQSAVVTLNIQNAPNLSKLDLSKQSKIDYLNLSMIDLVDLRLSKLEADILEVFFLNVKFSAFEFEKLSDVNNIVFVNGGTNISYVPENILEKLIYFIDEERLADFDFNYTTVEKNTTTLSYTKNDDDYVVDLPDGLNIERITLSNPDFVVKDGKLMYKGDDFETAVKDFYYDYYVFEGSTDSETDITDEMMGDRTAKHRSQYLRVYPTFVEKVEEEELPDKGEETTDSGDTANKGDATDMGTSTDTTVVAPVVDTSNAATAPITGDTTNQGFYVLLGLLSLWGVLKTRKRLSKM
ncbi:hypothetical protein A4S06_02805 [Erysipelotrichaceae bacterium MTC7]|nr:hypothetical protein A4S06_02805 [Erysipelotrichaceae bacterium MTC7]